MNRKGLIGLILFLFVALNFAGCVGVNGNFKRMRRGVLNNLNDEYKRVVELSVGPTTLAFASSVISFSGEDETAEELLKDVNRVQVGVFEREYEAKEMVSSKQMNEIIDIFEDDGWHYIVKVAERDEMTLVFIRQNEEKIHHMFVVALSDEDLAMVEVRGNLDHMAEVAIRDQGLNFHIADN